MYCSHMLQFCHKIHCNTCKGTIIDNTCKREPEESHSCMCCSDVLQFCVLHKIHCNTCERALIESHFYSEKRKKRLMTLLKTAREYWSVYVCKYTNLHTNTHTHTPLKTGQEGLHKSNVQDGADS